MNQLVSLDGQGVGWSGYWMVRVLYAIHDIPKGVLMGTVWRAYHVGMGSGVIMLINVNI